MSTMHNELKTIKERAEKATDGPWDESPASTEWKANKANNADFIRHARTDIPRLLLVIEKLIEQRDGWYQYGGGLTDRARYLEEDLELEKILNDAT